MKAGDDHDILQRLIYNKSGTNSIIDGYGPVWRHWRGGKRLFVFRTCAILITIYKEVVLVTRVRFHLTFNYTSSIFHTMNSQRPKTSRMRHPGGPQARELAALTRELSRCCLDKEERICRTFGLHAAEGRVLAAIHGEQLHTASELADRLRIGNSRLTPLIDRLAKKGLLTRAESGDDRRVRRLELTESGLSVAQRMQTFETHLHQQLLAKFPAGERPVLMDTLQHLKAAMDEIRTSIGS